MGIDFHFSASITQDYPRWQYIFAVEQDGFDHGDVTETGYTIISKVRIENAAIGKLDAFKKRST